MTFEELRQATLTLERTLANGEKEKDAVIEDLSKQLTGVRQELETSQKRANKEREEKEKYKQQLSDFEAEFITKTTNVEARIATLRAEQEVLARRDRESRNELDRLQHMKNGSK
jgi:chromosome segregation ATPase